MKLNKRKIRVTGCAFLAAAVQCVHVMASPSISDLQDKHTVSVSSISTDETNTAELLSKAEIYTDFANSDEYKVLDDDGNLQPTNLSEGIDLARETLMAGNDNGKSIVDSIPAVQEILKQLDPEGKTDLEKEYGCDPALLDQLTYMLDFKYTLTGKRVAAGEEVEIETKTTILDNGMIEASIMGGEIIRSANKEDFLVIQADPVSGEIYALQMKDYDEKTGEFVVVFPCVGPYMITQIMER